MARHWEWQTQFDLAARVLADEPGMLERAKDDHVAFRFVSGEVRLVFYPHKTTAGHRHIRIRLEPCRDREKALALARRLDDAAGPNCTFSMKLQNK